MSLDDTNTAGQTRADLRWHKTACNLCYINCGVEVGVAGEGAQTRVPQGPERVDPRVDQARLHHLFGKRQKAKNAQAPFNVTLWHDPR